MARPGITIERLAALCFIAVLAFNPPLLMLFDTGGLIAGMPALYVYLFATWAVLIIAIAWLVESSSGRRDLSEADSNGDMEYEPTTDLDES